MSKHVCRINQSYWCSELLPYLTLRATDNSIVGYKPHSHNELSIGLIRKGQTNLDVQGNSFILHQGEGVIIAPKLVHSCNPVDEIPRSYYMLYLDHDWCCRVLSGVHGSEIKQFTCQVESIAPAQGGRLLLNRLDTFRVQESRDNALVLEVELVNLIRGCCHPTQALAIEPSAVHAARSLLLDDLSDAPPLNDIAKQLGLPCETLIRQFKRTFGMTPIAFLNNERIQRAKLLLRSGSSIVDAALSVGFSDQSQLHRAFVKYTASTPGQYQKPTSICDNIC